MSISTRGVVENGQSSVTGRGNRRTGPEIAGVNCPEIAGTGP
jgi:hypothetical protein